MPGDDGGPTEKGTGKAAVTGSASQPGRQRQLTTGSFFGDFQNNQAPDSSCNTNWS
jgi:hypothetical protein